MKFRPIDPIPRVGGGGGWGFCGQNICYHVAAFVILFNFVLHQHRLVNVPVVKLVYLVRNIRKHILISDVRSHHKNV